MPAFFVPTVQARDQFSASSQMGRTGSSIGHTASVLHRFSGSHSLGSAATLRCRKLEVESKEVARASTHGLTLGSYPRGNAAEASRPTPGTGSVGRLGAVSLSAAAGSLGAALLALGSGVGAALAAELSAAAAGPLVSQGVSLQDACAQELGVSDLNTLIVVACIVEFLALTGAAVGGYVARQRKQEVEKINAQLRQININLRKQARVESYAPALSYAPVGSPAAAAAAAAVSLPLTVPSPPSTEAASARDHRKDEVLRILRLGKQHLRNSNPAAAGAEFQKALALAKEIGDTVEVKKAARGVGASFQRQGKYRDSIKYHEMVLDISGKHGEHSGDTEAYGAIADCYTELGDLEAAAKYYDRYINRLEEEED